MASGLLRDDDSVPMSHDAESDGASLRADEMHGFAAPRRWPHLGADANAA